MYFYVRSILLDNTRLSKIDYLHYLPFLLAFIGSIPYLLSSYDTKLLAASELLSLGGNNRVISVRMNAFFPNFLFGFMRTMQLIAYTTSIWRLMWVHHNRLFLANASNAQLGVIKNWLFIICISMTQFCLTSAVINIIGLTSLLKADLLRNTGIFIWISSINYVGINFALFFYPQILYGLPIYHSRQGRVKNVALPVAVLKKEPVVMQDTPIEKQAISNLIPLFDPEYVGEIEQLLEDVVASEKYLNPSFTVAFLSSEIEIPIHHLSFYFNNVIKTTFSNWRNSLRVEHAKGLIEDGVLDSITLQALGEQCGFSTNNTFIRSFKNHTGLSPSAFAKMLDGGAE
jgi:AraC-like DNA-binding protein